MHFCIVSLVLLYFDITVSCTGLDPWNVKHDSYDESSNPWGNQKIEVTQACVKKCDADSFYKRLLKLLTAEIEQDTDDIKVAVEAGVNFKFSRSDYKIIQDYLLSDEELTPIQYRRLDGILFDSILEESYIKTTFIYFLKTYYFHGIVVLAATWCMYMLYNTHWSSFSTRPVIFCIFFLIVYVWESMIAIKEVESKYQNEFMELSKPCVFLFWTYDCKPFVASVSYYWTHLHPLRIIWNLISKLAINNAFEMVDSFNKRISEQCPFFTQTAVHVGLNVLFTVFTVMVIFALLCNVVFNRPVSLNLSFLGLNFKQKHPDRHSQQSHFSHLKGTPSEDGNLLSGENLRNFLKATSSITKREQNPINITNNGRFFLMPINKLRKRKDLHNKKTTSKIKQ